MKKTMKKLKTKNKIKFTMNEVSQDLANNPSMFGDSKNNEPSV